MRGQSDSTITSSIAVAGAGLRRQSDVGDQHVGGLQWGDGGDADRLPLGVVGQHHDVPTWSPDGKQVAFYSNAQGNPQIFVIPSEGGATRRLTSLTAGATFPRWSRDGKWIYFSSKESGTAQVWKAPSGGGQAVQVTHGGGLIASESPDGKWLYFSGEGADSSLRKMPVGRR